MDRLATHTRHCRSCQGALRRLQRLQRLSAVALVFATGGMALVGAGPLGLTLLLLAVVLLGLRWRISNWILQLQRGSGEAPRNRRP